MVGVIYGEVDGDLVFMLKRLARYESRYVLDEDGNGVWPAEEQLSWMPKDVIALGYTGGSPAAGVGLFFKPDREQEIVSRLAKHGYSCERDDERIRRLTRG